MIVVYAIDALEHTLVESGDYQNLKQAEYGRTDISEFSEPRTMVLWSSFMTGENREAEVLSHGDHDMWNIKRDIEETFFKEFENPAVLDLPGYNYDLDVHEQSRILLKKYFESENPGEKQEVKKKYNNDAFDHHRKVKEDFTQALEEDHDFILGYFSVADVIGHLNFGNKAMMGLIYKDLDELALQASEKADKMLVISDHGMKAIGGFGDHSEYGYWSTSWKSGLEKPRITDFAQLLTEQN